MAKNIYGKNLTPCSMQPLTGFFRTGYCDTCGDDRGMHTVCAEMTVEFLAFSQKQGNDLITPLPEYQFPGLNPGDLWCLCLNRWVEAYQAGVAPRIKLSSTHISVTEFIDREILEKFALPEDSPEV